MTEQLEESTCPHCGKPVIVTPQTDMSGCPRVPQCRPPVTLRPEDAWPDQGSDDDDDDNDDDVPIVPRERVTA